MPDLNIDDGPLQSLPDFNESVPDETQRDRIPSQMEVGGGAMTLQPNNTEPMEEEPGESPLSAPRADSFRGGQSSFNISELNSDYEGVM